MAEELKAGCKNRIRILYKELEEIVEAISKDEDSSSQMERSLKSTETKMKSSSRAKRPDQQLYVPKRHQTDQALVVSDEGSCTSSVDVKSSVKSTEVGVRSKTRREKADSSVRTRRASPCNTATSPSTSTSAKNPPLSKVKKSFSDKGNTRAVDLTSPQDDEHARVESVEFVNSRIRSAEVRERLENVTINDAGTKTATKPEVESRVWVASEDRNRGRERPGSSRGRGHAGRRRTSDETSVKTQVQVGDAKKLDRNSKSESVTGDKSPLKPVEEKPAVVANKTVSDDNETLEIYRIPYKPQIIDWSAEVDDEIELEENTSETSTFELESTVQETLKDDQPRAKVDRRLSRRSRSGHKRSRSGNVGNVQSREKSSSAPNVSPVVSSSSAAEQKLNAGGGILRVELGAAAAAASAETPRRSAGTSNKSPADEKEAVGKQLFDPDHPERPLCVVPPASHLNSERKMYVLPTVTTPCQQRPPRPAHIPYGSMSPQSYMMPYRMISPNDVYQRYPMPLPSQRPGNSPYFPHFPQGNPNEYHGLPVPPYSLNATEKNMHEVMMLETQLNILLSTPFKEMDLKQLGQCRWKIQLRYENTILSDMDFCTKHNVEQALWKAAFYQVIENFRRQMMEEPTANERIRQAMISLIDEGSVFYENLLEKLQETYGFRLGDFLDSNAIRPTSLSRSVKWALLSAQKVTICLGDLVRYREQATDGCSYGKARSWYLKAQQLAPKNGRPYNQLAILAVYARRKLDAVYYYMRSLSASNPFQSAKEGLINIFDDARKKYEKSVEGKTSTVEGVWKQSKQQQQQRDALGPTSSSSTSKGRVRGAVDTKRGVVEVWYSPDGQVINHGSLIDEDDDDQQSSNSDNNDDHVIRNMQPVDLSKTFSLSFLHVHGKLYSRVGMETFTEACVKMFREFRYLLRVHPSVVNSQRLVQIVTINMFAIDNAGLKGSEVLVEPHCQTVIQGKALEVGVEMFRLIVARCEELLEEADGLNLNEDLNNLLPAVKIWCDWLLCHPSIWNPLPSLTDYCTGSDTKDVWTHLAALLNALKRWDTVEPFLPTGRIHDECEPVILPEDTSLAGFVPLLALPQETVFVRAPMDKDFAINLFRIKRIQYCGEFLCGIRPAVLDYSVETQSYVPLTNDSISPPNTRIQEVATENDSTESVVDSVEEPSEDWDTDDPLDSNANATCLHLRSRKQQLEKVKAHQEQQQRQIQAVLQQVSELSDIRFEVHPKWLVPDTNCFIDHLTDIHKLVLSCRFHLVVPLVVINELEGLARNVRNYSNVNSHSYKVGQEAQKALKSLSEWTSRRNPYVRAITAKGSLLDSIAFRSETDNYDKTSTNDDIILSCCMHLCQEDNNTKGQSSTRYKRKDKDDVIRICRDVVLLTDDRNLRVKAHAQEMAVKDIPRFMSMMNLSVDHKQQQQSTVNN